MNHLLSGILANCITLSIISHAHKHLMLEFQNAVVVYIEMSNGQVCAHFITQSDIV